MNWGSSSEFFAMGGKGLYVWGSYAMTFVCIAIELASLVLRHRGAERTDTQA